VAYIRPVKTVRSVATAVRIVHSSWRCWRKIEHIRSAHTPEEIEALKAVAKERLDQAVAAAMIDRIVHGADVLTLKGASYRLRGRGIDSLPSIRTTTNQGES